MIKVPFSFRRPTVHVGGMNIYSGDALSGVYVVG